MKAGEQVFFLVVGAGTFPFDMLRYECAYPALEVEASGMDIADELGFVVLGTRVPHGESTVTLEHRRWASFGWGVVPPAFGGETVSKDGYVALWHSPVTARRVADNLDAKVVMNQIREWLRVR